MDYIKISEIHEYLYCQKRWYYRYNNIFSLENQYIDSGTNFHENVHSKKIEKRIKLLIIKELNLFNDELFVYGKSDLIEGVPNVNGIFLKGCRGAWDIYPVEFKVGKIKIEPFDRAQLCLQALCLEYMFNTKIPYGYISYGKEKKREMVELDSALRGLVFETLNEIRNVKQISDCKRTGYCKGCAYDGYCNELNGEFTNYYENLI